MIARARPETDQDERSGSNHQEEPSKNVTSGGMIKQTSTDTDIIEKQEDAAADLLVDRRLAAMWDDLRRDMKRDVDPDTAALLDTISLSELTGPNAWSFFKKLADSQLGPLLGAMGINEIEPFEFFISVCRLSTFLQFISCGILFYSLENFASMDAGQAAHATAGLALGYLTRPFFKMEAILYPLYNGVLRVLDVQAADYTVLPSGRDAVRSTLNNCGITLALAYFLPQLLWGWEPQQSSQFVAPLCAGWLLFDASYAMGLLLELRRRQ
eukprot:CAMPEP_0119109562 /NCGR_PEP_ID=MMETSP1180-20130426/20554_1 /TAXON_ID=3052 ORGANISM="Chlamydomonas cf sp, Strain CCMP681" /NCGR_SAMPLE_ID=MMETSP1180 /ASSEMBLY_ACC=CAM_ASM_000741 /LENGTH=268 /DNA_ID=CAMNT_0007095393 /DNA_START=170 /DNA_END=976 /DNA_ORIENTATION=+